MNAKNQNNKPNQQSNDSKTSESKTSTAHDKNKVINLQRIYVRDISLEVPNAPHVFEKEWRPKVDAHVNSSSRMIKDNVYESSLKIEVTAKNDSKIAFIVDVTQCGSFVLANLNREELSRTLGVTCPNTLFPYARETLDNLLMKGGMPPMHLAQINFHVLYETQKRDAEARAPADSNSGGGDGSGKDQDLTQNLNKKFVINIPQKDKIN